MRKEVLLVTAVLVACSSGGLPYSYQRRAEQTMADIRYIATAWEARATDVNTYFVGRTEDGRVSYEDLSRALSPTYMRSLPRNDGWGNPFVFEVTSTGHGYNIRSFGANGRPDPVVKGPTTDPNADIVYSNGLFVSYPAAVAKE